MQTKNTHFRIFAAAVILTLCNLLLAMPFTSSAQSNQDVTLSISPYYNWETPLELTIPQTFINKTADTLVYQPYDPSNINEYIKVYDLRDSGGFTVTLAITNFTDGVHTIPYTGVGIVTLANASQPNSVDTPGPTSYPNKPDGTDNGTVFSTLDCDWDRISDFRTSCENTFHNFTGTGIASDSQTIIDGAAPTGTGRVGQYWLALGIRLLIPQGTVPGNYQSTFTFSLTPDP